jgi:hypothetical protein
MSARGRARLLAGQREGAQGRWAFGVMAAAMVCQLIVGGEADGRYMDINDML